MSMLDTNICIYLMREQPEQVLRRFAQCYVGDVVMSATRERKKDQLDKLIAAHAIALHVTLVTNNERDFFAYPSRKIENWVKG